MKEAFQDTRQAAVTALGGSVEVVTRAELARCPHWAHAFSSQRKDHRYYELVEDTIRQDFDYRYFVIKDGRGEICAVQPFFLLDQDLLAGIGGPVTAAAEFVRRLWPGFMRMRTLMVGCAAGEGHLDRIDELSRRFDAQLLAGAIEKHARDLKARLIVLKEFPAEYRASLWNASASTASRAFQACRWSFSISSYSSFDDYMSEVSEQVDAIEDQRESSRTSIGVSPIEMSVMSDITEIVDDVYPLYLQVYGRSTLHFEKLTQGIFLRPRAHDARQGPFFRLAAGRKARSRFSICAGSGRRDLFRISWARLRGRAIACIFITMRFAMS